MGKAGRPSEHGKRKRLLVVDDDEPIRQMLARALVPTGHAIETAADGEAALDRIAAWRPHVVLLDLMMPRVDGLGVLARLRADPALAPTRVIVVTARADRGTVQQAFGAGADDYVGKPFDLGEVVARVRAQLRSVDDRAALDRQRRDGEILLAIGDELARRRDIPGILQALTVRVAAVLGTDRCAVVLIDDDGTGRMIAANDDAPPVDRAITLADYPEIGRVIDDPRPLIVPDVDDEPLFDPVRAELDRLPIRGAALFPLLDGDRCIGVLFLRSTRRLPPFGERERQFGALVAHAAAAAIVNARLIEVLRRFAERDKLAVVAEVAGAAAHELNQPLTSVMGYAELLERRVPPDDALALKASRTIRREAERMADIVRRIGQLTRYETRPYVGGARIVDLDASSPPPDDSTD